MKKITLVLLSICCTLLSYAQVKSGDAALDKRLAAYLKANEEKDFETVMDYMHPKLFKLAPRQALISAMKSAFESDEMEINLSGLAITKAETTSFKSGGSEYRKVEYRMTMKIKFIDTTVYEPEFIEQMTGLYKETFESKKVTYDAKSKTFIISGTDILYAIKDAGKEWLFLGYKNDPDMIKKLFSKEVADHYKMME